MQRQVFYIMCLNSWRKYLLQNYTISNLGGSSALPRYSVNDLQIQLSSLMTVENALAYGSTHFDVRSPEGDQIPIMFNNACVASGLGSDCEKFSFGVLKYGLHETILSSNTRFVSALHDFMAVLASNGSTPSFSVLNSTLSGNFVVILLNLLFRFSVNCNYFSRNSFPLHCISVE